jgi:hypothetical protein
MMISTTDDDMFNDDRPTRPSKKATTEAKRVGNENAGTVLKGKPVRREKGQD